MQFGAEVDVEFRPGRHGRHHCLKPQQPGDTELTQRETVFAGQLLAGAVGLIGVGGVTDVAQLGEDLAQRQLCVGPLHVQAMVGQVQPRLGHRRQAAQVFLDQPAAGGATDAFHQQGGFGELARVTDEGLLHVRAVVQRQFIGQLHRQGFGVGRGFAAMLVIAFQTTGDDGFGHGLTAGAAELAGLPEHDGGEAAARRDGQSAVVAGEWGGHLVGHKSDIGKTDLAFVVRGFIPDRLRSSR
ncbi:UmuC domain-containing protein [Pseudomonas sp. IT-93MI4]